MLIPAQLPILAIFVLSPIWPTKTQIFYGASVVCFIMKPQKAWSEGKLGLQWREMKLQTVENCSLENAASVNEGYPRLRGGILGNLLTLLLEIISYA